MKTRIWLHYVTGDGSPLCTRPLADLRRDANRVAELSGAPVAVHRVWDTTIPGRSGPGIRVRCYQPRAEQPCGTLVYFHGGGWTLGSIESHEPVCRVLARAAGCLIISVDYRLAPDHKFPAALHDCLAVTRWAFRNCRRLGSPRKVAIGGDSAGGNLAAAVALWNRDTSGPAALCQLLVCPAVGDPRSQSASYRAFGSGYFLTASDMLWFWQNYSSSADDERNPYALPLEAREFSGLPPAIILTAEYDPLRDDGERYAEKLRDAGVPVFLKRYDGAFHGFWNMAGVLDAGQIALRDASAKLREAFENASEPGVP